MLECTAAIEYINLNALSLELVSYGFEQELKVVKIWPGVGDSF